MDAAMLSATCVNLADTMAADFDVADFLRSIWLIRRSGAFLPLRTHATDRVLASVSLELPTTLAEMPSIWPPGCSAGTHAATRQRCLSRAGP